MSELEKNKANESQENEAKKSNENSNNQGGVKTSDGEVIETSGVHCVRLLLSGLSDDSELIEDKMLNLKDTFDRLTENFIKYNTKKDIMAFIRHQTILKLMDAIMR